MSLSFVLPCSKEISLPIWRPGVFCSCLEVALQELFHILMSFWCICGEAGNLPILLFCHLLPLSKRIILNCTSHLEDGQLIQISFKSPSRINHETGKYFISDFLIVYFSSVQFSHSVMSDSLRPRGPQYTRPPCPSPTSRAYSNSSINSIESVMPSNHLTLCHPLLLLPSIFPDIRVFFNESVPQIRRSKYWSFSLSISPSNESSELISFKIDCFDLLAVKGLSRVFSNTRVHKHQFLCIQPSLWSNSHNYI